MEDDLHVNVRFVQFLFSDKKYQIRHFDGGYQVKMVWGNNMLEISFVIVGAVRRASFWLTFDQRALTVFWIKTSSTSKNSPPQSHRYSQK